MRLEYMPLKDFDVSTCVLTEHPNQPDPIFPPTDWYPSLAAAGLRQTSVHGPARYWLQVQGSFTRALQRQCTHSFHVRVLREGFARPLQEEARQLNIAPRKMAWIREVCLCGDNEDWVLARTVIPVACLRNSNKRLRHIGNKPLGHYLFRRPHWHRDSLLTGICKPSAPGQPELARRSVLRNHRNTLLVSEYFLPALYRQR